MLGHLLVALVLIAGEFDVQGNAVVETRAGEAPILAGTVPQAFVAEIVTPSGGVEYRDPALSFRISYSPRLYWSHPNALMNWSPLLLHTADLVLTAKTSRRFSLQAALTGAYGEPDYTALQVLVGTSQSTLPALLKIASATGRIAARAELTHRWELDVDGQLFYWKALGEKPVDVPLPLITEQKSAAEQALALFRLTPRHTLGFGVSASQASYSTGLDVYTVGPTVAWKVHLTPVDDLRLALGLTYLRVPTMSGVMPLLGANGQTVSPVGAFELVSRVARQDELLILANAIGGVDYYVDPIIGTAAPRARVGLGITAIMLPNWLGTVRGDFATALRSVALQPIGGLVPDETVFSLVVAARRRISIGFFAELGVTWAERAPALVTPNFEFRERQLWVYAQLSWTSHPLPHQFQ